MKAIKPSPTIKYFLLIGLLFPIAYAVQNSDNAKSAPDFAAMKDTKERKNAFFTYLLPYVREVNAAVHKERKDIQETLSLLSNDSPLEQKHVLSLCNKYRAKCDKNSTRNSLNTLLKHVDIVPESLVLAQAANESSWGRSRFAKEANNYFGQWCFTKGCGLVPKKRNAGATHEVRKFDSVKASVESYILNLNSTGAYQLLRDRRALLRKNGDKVTGISLANGLNRYSERGNEYIKELKSMIQHNKLSRYNTHYE